MLQVLPVCMALAERRYRRNRCIPFYRQLVRIGGAFPRLHPKGTSSRFALRAPRRLAPRNDKSGAITVLTGACTSRQRCAGSGMPLPYNSGCGRRNCFKICNCQWRSVSAATDAIGLYVLSVARLSRQRCAGPGCPRPYNTLRYDGALISHTRRGTAACGRFSGGGTARPACRTLPRRRAPEK